MLPSSNIELTNILKVDKTNEIFLEVCAINFSIFHEWNGECLSKELRAPVGLQRQNVISPLFN